MSTDYHRNKDGRELALEARLRDEDRLFSPSAARNHQAIGEAYGEMMPHEGRILEFACGTGEHAAHIAGRFAGLDWQPSDPDPSSRASAAAWAAHEELKNIRLPMNIDVTTPPEDHDIAPGLAGVVCINMIHIAPFSACEGVFHWAGKLLGKEGRLFLYGPFKRDGETAPSNLRFDESLRERNPAWGVRDLDQQLMALAEAAGLPHLAIQEMSANNLSVVFARTG